MKPTVLALVLACISPFVLAQHSESSGFAGRLKQNEAATASPRPVRNDVTQPGEEISTLRYFKIKKGTFPEFLKASQEGVWPYFEKIGSRVVGMWKVVHPPVEGDVESADYDEVYLMTRYASVAHWEASREPQKHGGNGPDWEACKKALDLRASLTLETKVTFLQGDSRNNPPMFLPGLDEKFEQKDVEPTQKQEQKN
jgi:hypothetical protein